MSLVRLYVLGGVLAVLAGLLLAGGWYAYEKGKTAQAVADGTKLDELRQANASCNASVEAVNQAAAGALIEAKARQDKAAALVAELQQGQAQAAQAADVWQRKYQQAVASSACSNAKEELCPALLDY